MASDRGRCTRWVGAALVLAAGTLGAAADTTAHSWLVKPLENTWDNSCRVGGTGGRDWKNCLGPCSRTNRRHNYEVATYRRGQTIPVVYTKNNHYGNYELVVPSLRAFWVSWVPFAEEHAHTRIAPLGESPLTLFRCPCVQRFCTSSCNHSLVPHPHRIVSPAGGFLRLSLVPVKHRDDPWTHDRNAFRWSCWSAGEVDCPKRNEFECGNDNHGRRYQQWVTIPPVFEDGLYVLGFVWYGGGYRQGTYWSCADVRIAGGPLQDNFNPVFVHDRCMSNTNALYQCSTQPCMQEEQWGKPREFEDGRRPGALNRWNVQQ